MTGKTISDDVLIDAMESLQSAHGEKLIELGTPPIEVLWQTTFRTKQPHTEFLGPPVLRYASPIMTQ